MQAAAEETTIEQAHSSLAPTILQPKTPDELADIVARFALSDGWIDRVRLNTQRRWYERLYQDAEYDIWVISWMPGQSTGFHDHGESSGAFVVATGTLEEHRPGQQPLLIHAGSPRAFNQDYAHDVRNASSAPAISIHAYSPPLSEMNEYELDEGQLVPREAASERVQALDEQKAKREGKPADRARNSSIEDVLANARVRLRRLSAHEAAHALTEAGTILVDIRPEAQRAIEGAIPRATIIERNVLEWRLDPASSSRLPIAQDHDVQIIVFCSEGFTSSLAAAALQDLGLWRATDLVGGFGAWRAAGLPIA